MTTLYSKSRDPSTRNGRDSAGDAGLRVVTISPWSVCACGSDLDVSPVPCLRPGGCVLRPAIARRLSTGQFFLIEGAGQIVAARRAGVRELDVVLIPSAGASLAEARALADRRELIGIVEASGAQLSRAHAGRYRELLHAMRGRADAKLARRLSA